MLRLLIGTVLLAFFTLVALVIVLEIHRIMEGMSLTTFERLVYWFIALPFTSIPTAFGWYLFKRVTRTSKENQNTGTGSSSRLM